MNEPLPEDVSFLEHFGVKGMKWGVINKDETSGSTKSGDDPAVKAKYMAVKDEVLSTKDQAAALVENENKFSAKFEVSDSKKDSSIDGQPSERRFTNKQIAKFALGAAFVGLVIYAGYKDQKLPPPGEPLNAAEFKKAVQISKMRTWNGQNYIKPSSFSQEEFTLPIGHTFHRISTGVESGFNPATYATHSTEDFNRYVAGFRQEKGSLAQLHHVTFQAKEEIRIPSLTTRLEAMRTVLEEDRKLHPSALGINLGEVTEKQVLHTYKQLSGGNWNDSTSKSFFKTLADKGYHAIVDDMDAGVIGESPLVIFRPEAFSSKSTTELTGKAIAQAESSLVEILNRK